MGRILEINGEYYVEFYGNGLRFQKKAGPSYEEAVRKLKSIEESLETSALKVDPAAVTVDLFRERYLSFCEQVHPPKTAARFKQTLAHFMRFLEPHLSGDRYLPEITPRMIELYKESLLKQYPYRPHLVNFTLYLIRDILQYCITLGWLNDNPTLHTPFLKTSRKYSPRIYSDGQIKALGSGLSEKDRLVFELLLGSGMTLDELKQLTWEHINIKSQSIEVETGFPDKSYTRIVPMDYHLLELIKIIKEKNPGDRLVFKNPELADGINPGILRNTFAKRLIERGVSLSQLYKLLGADDIAKVFRYQVFLP
ncbi:MAG: tyrosine-type recombinase/integrase [Candidatus Omnitrophota bacterium]